MQSRWRFPIRFKLLITALFLITAVVSAITFAMARLFHDDKTAYIHDLTSTLALHAARETRSLLASYGERLQVFARVMQERGMPKEQKTRLLRNLFEDFEDFVAITHSVNGREQATVYDRNTLKAARLTMHQLASHRNGHPLPYADIQAGSAFVENSTIVESLPTLTLTVPYQTAPRLKSNAVIAAVVRLERLLDLAGPDGEVRATHQELAVELGTAREVIGRQLKELERRGWVALARGRIALRDPGHLKTLAEAD